MINFIQLNQNLTKAGWDGKIISTLILDNIHDKLNDKHVDIIDVIGYIHENSIQMNMDKSTILNNYFDHVIRNKRDFVSRELLNIISDILHCSDAKPDVTICYCCHQLRRLYTNPGLVANSVMRF